MKPEASKVSILRVVAIIGAVLILGSATGSQNAPPRATNIALYESSEEKHESLAAKPPLTFGTEHAPALTITVDDATKYQEIDGFGASLTESSAWLLKRKLTDAQRSDALRMLFDRERGIGLSMLRQPMGASDFALQESSYDELLAGETDPELKKF